MISITTATVTLLIDLRLTFQIFEPWFTAAEIDKERIRLKVIKDQ